MELTKGDKEYLKGHGVTESEFDRMDETSKKEWKEECQMKTYEDSWVRKDAKGSKSFSVGQPSPKMLRIWRNQKKTEKKSEKTYQGDKNLDNLILRIADN